MKNYLIVYYSRTGTAKKAAERLYSLLTGISVQSGADSSVADIEEIIDFKNRNGLFGFLTSVKDCLSDNITRISEARYSPSKYFETIVVTPVWGGKMADAIRTYLASGRSEIRSLSVVACSDNTGGDSVSKDILRKLAIKPKRTVSIKRREIENDEFSDKFSEIIKESKNLKIQTRI